MINKMKLTSSLFLLAGLLLQTGCLTTTPLIDAARRGDAPAVKTLLDNGADVNDLRTGYTPLMCAAGNGNAAMVKLLISRGADPNLRRNSRSLFNGTALAFAASKGHGEVIDLLIDNGADVDAAIAALEYAGNMAIKGGISDAYAKNSINNLRIRLKWVARRKGWACYSKGESENGITFFNQAIQQNPTDDDSFAGLAACHNALGQYDEAVTAAKQAIALNPQSGNGHLRLGYAYQCLKQNGEAEKKLKRAVDLLPKDPNINSSLALFYFQTRRYSEALSQLRRQIELLPKEEPGLSNVLTWVMVCHYHLGNYDDVIAVADQFIKIVTTQPGTHPNVAYGYDNKGLAYREKGDRIQAAENAQKAMELCPAGADAHSASACLALDNGQFADAIKILSPIPVNNTLLATAYAKSGQFDAAAKLYLAFDEETLLLLQKSVPHRARRQAFLAAMRPYTQKLLENAMQLEANQQLEAALVECVKAVAVAEDEYVDEVRTKMFHLAQRTQPKESEEVYRHSKRGDILLGEGKFEDAIGEYNRALRLAPYSPRLYFNAALIHGSLKNYAKASQHMKAYVELVPNAPNIQAAKDALIEWELKMEKSPTLIP